MIKLEPKNYLYENLTNLNTGYDHKNITHLCKFDMITLLNRAQKIDLIVGGVEIWKEGKYLDTKNSSDQELIKYGKKWAIEAVNSFENQDNLTFSASVFTKQELASLKEEIQKGIDSGISDKTFDDVIQEVKDKMKSKD